MVLIVFYYLQKVVEVEVEVEVVEVCYSKIERMKEEDWFSIILFSSFVLIQYSWRRWRWG